MDEGCGGLVPGSAFSLALEKSALADDGDHAGQGGGRRIRETRANRLEELPETQNNNKW